MLTRFTAGVCLVTGVLAAITLIASFTPSFPCLTTFIPLAVESRTQAVTDSVSNNPQLNDFVWNDLKPSAKLIWRDCYSAHQCARLIVPLNYSEPDGEKAVIALTRLPSPFPTDSHWYRGPILINPGGPGGSGVDIILRVGTLLQSIVGPQFDLVGFDPRGIGRSTPRVSFFETALERELWDKDLKINLKVLNASADGIARAWARAKINGQLAAERQLDILGHINTDQTARDMLRIMEAHGKEKLQYWGFSYGSILGATFAAMFPDKIERLVIDGVADAEDYYAALWSNNLLDTDKIMQAFFSGCHSAGPSACLFYASSPAAIEQNLAALYEMVRLRPVPVRTKTSYGIVDYNRLRQSIFTSLYSPYATFASLAEALADLAERNGERLFQFMETPAFQCNCDARNETFFDVVGDAGTAISCNDGDVVSSEFEDLQAYFEKLTNKSTWGDMWAGIRTSCIGWPQLPKNHFRGPFIGNTSFPLLLVGNTADPVTPLWAAKKMAKGFPGSVVLTQDSPGHCSISGPSLCTQKYIRAYFVNGTLPDPDTVCPVKAPLFPNSTQMSAEDQAIFELTLSADDMNILNAVRSLSTLYRLPLPL